MNNIFSIENMQIFNSYLFEDLAFMSMYCFCNTTLHDCCECSFIQPDAEVSRHNTIEEIKDAFSESQELFKYTKTTKVYQDSLQSSTKQIIARTQRKLIIKTHNFDENIATLLVAINKFIDDHMIIVHGKRKNIAKVRNSNRRSTYTGVFKNGDNWQAFISINTRKTYLGTFSTQEEAAKTFDFYSILVHGLTAKTNFDYSKTEIINMVEDFIQSSNKLGSTIKLS